jgi:hypothetical protein
VRITSARGAAARPHASARTGPSTTLLIAAGVIDAKTAWTDFVREHLPDTYTGHFNRDEPLTPVLISLAKTFAEENPKQPVLLVDVGAASYQGLDVSDTIFLGKRLKEAGINNFMFHSFEPGVGPMARWGTLAAACDLQAARRWGSWLNGLHLGWAG